MALEPGDVARLDAGARAVGEAVGWDLEFVVAPNPEYVRVTAGREKIFVLGPSKLCDLAAYEIDLQLDALERGEREDRPDEDGDPRLF